MRKGELDRRTNQVFDRIEGIFYRTERMFNRNEGMFNRYKKDGSFNRELEGIAGKYGRMPNRVAQMDANSMGRVSKSSNSS